MLAKDLISDAIPPLKTSDSGLKALTWMEEFRVAHLPIVNGTNYLGLITEEDVLNLNAGEEPLGNHPLSLAKPYVSENQHFYEVIKIIDALKLTLIPVLDTDMQYVGIITATDLVHYMSEIAAIKEEGGIIILELNKNDYSLKEVAHIVESNDGLILSSYVTSHPDSTKMLLTLKINKSDLSRILAAFFRLNFIVTASYHQSDMGDSLKDRYDSFMKYLDI